MKKLNLRELIEPGEDGERPIWTLLFPFLFFFFIYAMALYATATH